MNITRLHWPLRLLLLNATLAMLTAGCATRDAHSYNQDFNQNLPAAPNYSIENKDVNRFNVTVTQGTPLRGMDGVIYVKQAASIVAGSEAKRRGWENWDLNYIQERNQGWMFMVIAEVTRKNAAVKTSDSTR
jgi:hypothetical protein